MTDVGIGKKPSRWQLSPLNRRRWQIFRANKRGYWSLWLFLLLLIVSLLSNVIANDRPLLISYKGEILTPLWTDYPEEKFGGFRAVTDYSDPLNIEEIKAHGWIVWAPVRYSYKSVNREIPSPAPSPPAFELSQEEACIKYPLKASDPACVAGNLNWLGTDDQGRDILARTLYGYRISVLFGIILTVFSAILGITAGAVQGYFGGWTDLLFQRFIEIWSSVPTLYLLIILSAFFAPNFWTLLFINLLFAWMALVGLVRAEFLRARNFEYVRAARALGLSNIRIMVKHLLPNALVSTLTMLPFIASGAIGTLTALDFLGFGLPPGSASLGEMVGQAKDNLHAPWIAITVFVVITLLLTLLVFIGEAARDALDPRKTFK